MPTAVSEAEIHAAARALDRAGLEAQGWTKAQIDAAQRRVREPSAVSLQNAKIALAAAAWARAMGGQ